MNIVTIVSAKPFWISTYFILSTIILSAQKPAGLDSLKQRLDTYLLDDTTRMELLRQLAFLDNDPSSGMKYANRLLELAESKRNDKYLHIGYLQKGYKLQHLGEYEKALQNFFKSVKHSEQYQYQKGVANTYTAIADLYSILQHHQNATTYYGKAIQLMNGSQDSVTLATIFLNTGDEFLLQKKYDSALFYFKQSSKLFDALGHQRGQAYNLGNMGMVYANKGQHRLAKTNMNKAIKMLQEMEDYYPICFYLLSMADIMSQSSEIDQAIALAEQSLDLAVQYRLKQQISDAHLKLYELHQLIDKPKKSLHHYQKHIIYRDSLTNLEKVQEIANQRTAYEISLRESKIESLQQEKKLQQTYVIIALVLLAFVILAMLYFRQRSHTTRLLTRKAHEDEIKNLLKNQETKTLQAMVEGKEDERKHLAQELHNHIGSLLATIKVNLNGLKSLNPAKQQTIVELVDQACQDVRNISHELNMGISENFGLIPAVKELVGHLQKVKDMKVEFSSSMNGLQINSESEILLYRIIQELISNVLKHANASKIALSLTGYSENDLVNIIIEDNGAGFDIDSIPDTSEGIGLSSLKELIEKMDGEMTIDSRLKMGSTIIIDLPVVKAKMLIDDD